MNEVSGILNVIKPLGWTSMDVVRKLKGLTRQKKVGLYVLDKLLG